MEVESLRVDVEPGVALQVRRWPGDPEQVPFLLVHGLSSNARLWDGVAQRLSLAGHPAFAVDLRSHGESDQPDHGYDTATAAADLDRIAEALDLVPAVVAGQSWGGNVVVQLAARFPARVRALGLVDGGWIDLRKSFGSWRACAAALRPPSVDGMHVDKLRGYVTGSHPDWAPWAVDATIANLRVLDGGRLERRLPIPRHMEIVRSMWDDPPSPYYPSITVPVLLMPAGGKRSASVVADAAATLADAKVREYPGADHDVHAQRPEDVADDLLGLI